MFIIHVHICINETLSRKTEETIRLHYNKTVFVLDVYNLINSGKLKEGKVWREKYLSVFQAEKGNTSRYVAITGSDATSF